MMLAAAGTAACSGDDGGNDHVRIRIASASLDLSEISVCWETDSERVVVVPEYDASGPEVISSSAGDVPAGPNLTLGFVPRGASCDSDMFIALQVVSDVELSRADAWIVQVEFDGGEEGQAVFRPNDAFDTARTCFVVDDQSPDQVRSSLPPVPPPPLPC